MVNNGRTSFNTQEDPSPNPRINEVNRGTFNSANESDPSPNPRINQVNRGTFNSANESDPSPSPTIKTLVANSKPIKRTSTKTEKEKLKKFSDF